MCSPCCSCCRCRRRPRLRRFELQRNKKNLECSKRSVSSNTKVIIKNRNRFVNTRLYRRRHWRRRATTASGASGRATSASDSPSRAETKRNERRTLKTCARESECVREQNDQRYLQRSDPLLTNDRRLSIERMRLLSMPQTGINENKKEKTTRLGHLVLGEYQETVRRVSGRC
jgi:hypothetical protein